MRIKLLWKIKSSLQFFFFFMRRCDYLSFLLLRMRLNNINELNHWKWHCQCAHYIIIYISKLNTNQFRCAFLFMVFYILLKYVIHPTQNITIKWAISINITSTHLHWKKYAHIRKNPAHKCERLRRIIKIIIKQWTARVFIKKGYATNSYDIV